MEQTIAERLAVTRLIVLIKAVPAHLNRASNSSYVICLLWTCGSAPRSNQLCGVQSYGLDFFSVHHAGPSIAISGAPATLSMHAAVEVGVERVLIFFWYIGLLKSAVFTFLYLGRTKLRGGLDSTRHCQNKPIVDANRARFLWFLSQRPIQHRTIAGLRPTLIAR